jgi:GNAT superfamily N-acetyltransferase
MTGIEYHRLTALPEIGQRMLEIDAIFFEASNTQIFTDDAERAAFRERWLGRYLDHWSDLAFVANDARGHVAGYLVGCLDNPALSPLFDDVGYFKTFATDCDRYPAHLHINLRADVRGQGIGSALIGAFAAAAAEAGAPGMHIVTSKSARNVGFYLRNGFSILREAPSNNGPIVFMGRPLRAPA